MQRRFEQECEAQGTLIMMIEQTLAAANNTLAASFLCRPVHFPGDFCIRYVRTRSSLA